MHLINIRYNLNNYYLLNIVCFLLLIINNLYILYNKKINLYEKNELCNMYHVCTEVRSHIVG